MSEQVNLHLISADQREREIAELYWSQDEEQNFVHGVREIAETFGISDREVRDIATTAAVAESTKARCTGCDEPRTFTSRQDTNRTIWTYRGYFCDECRNRQQEDELRAQEERRREQRQQITDSYATPDDRVLNPKALPLELALGLLALIRVCANEPVGRLEPLDDAGQRIAPGLEHIYELLKRLTAAGVIYVDSDSDIEAFDWEVGKPARYYLDRVCWRLPGPETELNRVGTELSAILEAKNWPPQWRVEAAQLQRTLAAHELSEYLVDRYAEHHFEFSPAEKTWEVLSQIAERFSIGQGYNLVWRATRDAASFYVREECEVGRAKAYGIGVLRRSFERATTAGWDLNSYNRPWRIDESELVHIFYRLFLGVQDPISTPPPQVFKPVQSGACSDGPLVQA